MRNRKNTQAVPDVPFGVGRSSGVSLARQIADGIRSAIASGYYKPGQILPTRKEFAKALGVSERAPREAVAMLAAEGVVYTRRCLGCVVAEPGGRRWLGRVLLVQGDYELSYYNATLFDSFSRKMAESGYLVTRLVCPSADGRTFDLTPLREALDQTFDFIFSMQTDRRIVALIRKSGVRHLVFSSRQRNAEDDEECVSVRVDEALSTLVEKCKRRNVKSVIQVGLKGAREIQDLREYVPNSRIKLTSWDLTVGHDRTGVENITYGAMQAFAKRLALGRRWLPDLLFFRDDFIAVGALIALLQAGVRVPEDVCVVTVANRGNCPVFPKSLARIELDPVENGAVYAERVLRALAPTVFKHVGSVAYRYVPGETFP